MKRHSLPKLIDMYAAHNEDVSIVDCRSGLIADVSSTSCCFQFIGHAHRCTVYRTMDRTVTIHTSLMCNNVLAGGPGARPAASSIVSSS